MHIKSLFTALCCAVLLVPAVSFGADDAKAKHAAKRSARHHNAEQKHKQAVAPYISDRTAENTSAEPPVERPVGHPHYTA